jgi:hypothetical protein
VGYLVRGLGVGFSEVGDVADLAKASLSRFKE